MIYSFFFRCQYAKIALGVLCFALFSISATAQIKSPADLVPEVQKDGITLNKPSIFSADSLQSTAVSPATKKYLDQLAEYLKKNPKAKVKVVGHSFLSQITRKDEGVSLERAENVKKYLMEKGTEKERISAIGEGSNYPISNPQTPEGRIKNNRVEITIIQ